MMYVLLFLPIKAKLLLIEERAKCFVFCGNNALAIKKIRLGGKGGGGARGGGPIVTLLRLSGCLHNNITAQLNVGKCLVAGQ